MAHVQVLGRHPFHVAPGDRILITGANGSGKTSILRAMAGLRSWTGAKAEWQGPDGPVDPRALDAPALAHAVAPAWQSPRDALVGLTVHGEHRMRRQALGGRWHALQHRPVAALSSGEARRLALDILPDVPLTLLDEPLEGLDAPREQAVRAMVLRRSQEGSVVFTDHTGRLHDLATTVVRLDGPSVQDLPAVPRQEGPVMLDWPGAMIEDRGVRLPPLRMGPGLHALTGPNACGKTTLLHALAGLLSASGAGPGTRLLLAEPTDQLVHQSVRKEVAQADPDVVARLVPQHLMDRHPLTLSGGEARRVALAKVLGSDARILLLDEPEAHLDPEARRVLWDLLAERTQGRLVLAATHDPALVAAAQEVVQMEAPAP